MPTIRKGDHASLPARHVSYRERVDQVRALAHAAIETGSNVNDSRRFEFPNPVDLRGIPAIGPSVAGHISGTQPESAATR